MRLFSLYLFLSLIFNSQKYQQLNSYICIICSAHLNFGCCFNNFRFYFYDLIFSPLPSFTQNMDDTDDDATMTKNYPLFCDETLIDTIYH